MDAEVGALDLLASPIKDFTSGEAMLLISDWFWTKLGALTAESAEDVVLTAIAAVLTATAAQIPTKTLKIFFICKSLFQRYLQKSKTFINISNI